MAERKRPVSLVHITTVPLSLGFMSGQVGYMKERGIDVAAISSPGEELQEFGAREDVPVHAVEMKRSISPLHDLVALFRLWRLLRRLRPDIVHAHTPKGGLLGTIAARLAGVEVPIYHVRGLPFMTAEGGRRILLRWTERVSCALARQVFCVSHSLREVAVAERICRPSRLKVLLGGSGNGVDASGRFNPERVGGEAGVATRERLGIPRDALVVGFVGRLVRDKGVVELVAAWEEMRDRFPGLHLVMVGPVEEQDSIPDAVLRLLRGDPRVRLLGMQKDTPPLYAAMDVVALPTYREGLPNVPLEAAAMGVPVVVTRIPGCVDAVEDGVTGILVPARDAVALRTALETYLMDGEMRRRHGEAARERVLRLFPREAIWKALFDEYRSLLGEDVAAPAV